MLNKILHLANLNIKIFHSNKINILFLFVINITICLDLVITENIKSATLFFHIFLITTIILKNIYNNELKIDMQNRFILQLLCSGISPYIYLLMRILLSYFVSLLIISACYFVVIIFDIKITQQDMLYQFLMIWTLTAIYVIYNYLIEFIVFDFSKLDIILLFLVTEILYHTYHDIIAISSNKNELLEIGIIISVYIIASTYYGKIKIYKNIFSLK